MKKIREFAVITIAAICVVFMMAGCGAGDSESDPLDAEENVEEEEVTVNDDETSEKEETLTAEELWTLDAENAAVTSIISKYKLEWTDDGYVEVFAFDDFIECFDEIKDSNLFADSLVAAAQNVPYDEYSTSEKVVFDTYLGLLFQDDVIQDDLPIGNITEAWYGEGQSTLKDGTVCPTQYYLLKFSEYKSDEDILSDRSKFVFLHYVDYGDGTYKAYKDPEASVYTEPGYILYGLYEYDGKMAFVTMNFGSVYVEAMDVSDLNNIIDSNQDFINFILDYRSEIYAPIRIAQLDAEKADKEAKKNEEEYWENKIPEIGMTAEEVEKTSWGSPDRINKDTYSWGTLEQWVYEDKGYVYFEDGIVTSVSER